MTMAPEMTALIDAASALTDLLEQENDALTRTDFEASCRLAESKRAAIIQLESATDLLLSPPSGPMPAELPLVRSRLNAAIEKNRTLLHQAIDTQQRAIATIVQTLDPSGVYPAVYGNHSQQRFVLPVSLAVRA